MRSLFLRIFLSFWLAQALFIVLAIVATLALRPRGEPQLPPGMAAEAAAVYEQSGPITLIDYIHKLEDEERLHFFLLDEDAQEVTGRRVPKWVADAHENRRHGFFGWLLPLHLLKQTTVGPSGHSYTLVAEVRPGPLMFMGPRGLHGLGLLIAVLTSGLVCYLLARYLTAPVVRLRAATQKLAAGDLTARAGVKSNRHDEIAELVRDFDGMAGRMETLVSEQNRLLNDISHELRSPLARLNVALGLARQRTGPEAASALDRMELESGRLEQMIARLLTLSRLEAGQELLDRSSLQLGELIQEIAKDADFEAQSRNCHVVAVVEQECTVTGSPALLRSAIENVVRNATRYTTEGTAVEVRLQNEASPGGSVAVIRVSDHGPGVPEAALGKLFHPFFRVDDARGRQTGGSGLGLAITERAVRLHGGTVSAANLPGVGLMVEIRLPLQTSNRAIQASN